LLDKARAGRREAPPANFDASTVAELPCNVCAEKTECATPIRPLKGVGNCG